MLESRILKVFFFQFILVSCVISTRYLDELNGTDVKNSCEKRSSPCKTFSHIQDLETSYLETIDILQAQESSKFSIMKSFTFTSSSPKPITSNSIHFVVEKSDLDVIFNKISFHDFSINIFDSSKFPLKSFEMHNVNVNNHNSFHTSCFIINAQQIVVENSKFSEIVNKKNSSIFHNEFFVLSEVSHLTITNCDFSNIQRLFHIQQERENFFHMENSRFKNVFLVVSETSEIGNFHMKNCDVDTVDDICSVQRKKGGFFFHGHEGRKIVQEFVIENCTFFHPSSFQCDFIFSINNIEKVSFLHTNLTNVEFNIQNVNYLTFSDIFFNGNVLKRNLRYTNHVINNTNSVTFHNYIVYNAVIEYNITNTNDISIKNFDFFSGSIYMRIMEFETAEISNCTIKNNMFLSDNLINEVKFANVDQRGVLSITDTTIENNYFLLSIQVIRRVYFERFFCYNNTAVSGKEYFDSYTIISSFGNAYVSIQQSEFSRNEIDKIAQFSEIDQMNFNDNKIIHNTAVRSETRSLFEFAGNNLLYFTNNFVNNNHVEIDSSSIIYILFIHRGTEIFINNNIITSNTGNHGIVQLERPYPISFDFLETIESPFLDLSYTKINNNVGYQGGAFHFKGIISSDTKMDELECSNNRAEWGGCVYLDANPMKEAFFSVSERAASWIDNYATMAGGTLFYSNEVESNKDNLLRNIATSRSLGFGNLIASGPTYYYIKAINSEIGYLYVNQTKKLDVYYIYPGISITLTIGSMDQFNQTINRHVEDFLMGYDLLNYTMRLLSGSVIGEMNKDGTVDFSYFSVRGNCGDSFQVEFYNVNGISKDTFTFTLIECPKYYEYILDDRGYHRCKECPFNSYKIIAGNEKCVGCEEGMKCKNGNVYASNGYWLWKGNNTNKVISYICIGGECEDGECAEFRDEEYPICEACLKGYTKIDGNCIESDATLWNFVVFFVTFILLCVFFIVMVHVFSNTIRMTPPTKIAVFFIQNLYIIRGNEIMEIYHHYSVESIIEVTEFLISFFVNMEWVHQLKFLKSPFYMSSFTVLFVGTFLKMLMFLIIISILGVSICVKKIRVSSSHHHHEDGDDEHHHKSINDDSLSRKEKCVMWMKKNIGKFFTINSLYKTSVFLFMTIYELLVDDVGKFFSCEQFGDHRHVVEYTDIICGTPTWWLWSIFYFFVLFIVVLFPIVLLVFLLVYKKRLFTHEIEERFGELYEEYRKNLFFFEVVAIFKCFLMVFSIWSGVMLFSTGPVPFVFFFFTIFFFLIITTYVKPYKDQSSNNLEIIMYYILSAITLVRIYSMRDETLSFFVFILSFCAIIGFIVNIFIVRVCCVKKIFRGSLNVFNRLKSGENWGFQKYLKFGSKSEKQTLLKKDKEEKDIIKEKMEVVIDDDEEEKLKIHKEREEKVVEKEEESKEKVVVENVKEKDYSIDKDITTKNLLEEVKEEKKEKSKNEKS